MIPVDKIFDLFKYDEDPSLTLGEDFHNSPYAKIGMFNKTIENSGALFIQIKKIIQESKTIEWNFENAVKSTNTVIFYKSFLYIKDIDINNLTHVDALKCYDPSRLISNLNQSISFFERKEEYEKCAHLLKIKNTIEEFSKIA